MKARLTTVEDAVGVFKVQKETWLDAYPNEQYGVRYEDIAEKFFNEAGFIAKIEEKIERYGKETCGWVVEIDGQIAGFSDAYSDGERDLIGAIYVLPKYQGQGIGKTLLQEVLSFYSDSKEIWLKVAAYNEKAIDFYQKFGFKVVPGSEGKHQIIEGKHIPIIGMRREG